MSGGPPVYTEIRPVKRQFEKVKFQEWRPEGVCDRGTAHRDLWPRGAGGQNWLAGGLAREISPRSLRKACCDGISGQPAVTNRIRGMHSADRGVDRTTMANTMLPDCGVVNGPVLSACPRRYGRCKWEPLSSTLGRAMAPMDGMQRGGWKSPLVGSRRRRHQIPPVSSYGAVGAHGHYVSPTHTRALVVASGRGQWWTGGESVTLSVST